MHKTILITAGLCGLLTVLLGAFGAHSLKEQLEPQKLESFQTAVRYLMYHALFLLWLGTTSIVGVKWRQWIFRSILVGIFLFCGSIIVLSTDQLTSIDLSKFGFITPVGGLFLIAGWVLLLIYLLGQKGDK